MKVGTIMLHKQNTHRMEEGTQRSTSARVAAHLCAQPCSGVNFIGTKPSDWRRAGP